MLAIIVALPEEAQGLLKGEKWEPVQAHGAKALYRLPRVGCAALLAISGVGREAAEAAGREVLDHKPQGVLSLGFAGCLVAGLPVGCLVVAERVQTLDMEKASETLPRVDKSLKADPELATKALQVLKEQGLPHRQGICLTISHVVAHPREKASLARTTGALAVEMESYWIGALCSAAGVPFLTVRAILDTAEESLPPFVAQTAEGGRWRSLAQTLLRPWRIPRLIHLTGAVGRAQQTLAAFAFALLKASVPARAILK